MSLLTSRARGDLEDIVAYLDHTQVSAVRQRGVLERIRKGFTYIDAYPDAPPVHPDFPGVRYHPVPPYVIYYLDGTNPPQVTRVLHGAMDPTFVSG